MPDESPQQRVGTYGNGAIKQTYCQSLTNTRNRHWIPDVAIRPDQYQSTGLIQGEWGAIPVSHHRIRSIETEKTGKCEQATTRDRPGGQIDFCICVKGVQNQKRNDDKGQQPDARDLHGGL